jgi:hypothetical protein
MDREKELMLEYIANTLLIEKLHREYGTSLKEEPTTLQEQVQTDMVVLQYQYFEKRNAWIMERLLNNKQNIKLMRRYTHTFSLSPVKGGYYILSPGCMNTQVLPFATNYRKVDFIRSFEKLINKTILEKYEELKLKQKIEK